MILLWIGVVLGAIVGGFELLNVMISSSMSQMSAPQEAAGAAMAAAFAIVPYVFVRACHFIAGSSGMGGSSPEERELKKLNATLEAHTRMLAQLANKSAIAQLANKSAV